jgi:hypothetical protein
MATLAMRSLTLFWIISTACHASELFIDFQLKQRTPLAAREAPPGAILREKIALVNRNALDSPGEVRLSLAAGETYAASLTFVGEREGNTRLYQGTLIGQRDSSVTLVLRDHLLAGNISTQDGKRFVIRPHTDGSVAIQELNLAAYPDEAHPLASPTAAGSVSPGTGVEDPSPTDAVAPGEAPMDDASVATIDLMVVYTPAVLQARGGAAQVQQMIDLVVAEANQSYIQSGVLQRLRVVHSGLVSYDEADGVALALQRLTSTSDGYLDEVHALRDRYQADVVTLLTAQREFCGVAWMMQTPSAAFESKAFSVVNHVCAADNYSLTHELGHLMGASHDRANAAAAGAFPYSYGWRRAGHVRTIMAYGCTNLAADCPRVGLWSNPDAMHEGMALGAPAASPVAADNRTTLNNTRFLVAQFRNLYPASSPGAASGTGDGEGAGTTTGGLNGSGGTTPVSGATTCASFQISASSVQVAASAGSITVAVKASSSCSWNVRSEVSWLRVWPVSSGTGDGQISATFHSNPASESRTGVLSLSQSSGSLTIRQAAAGTAAPAAESGEGLPLAFHFGGEGDIPLTGDWDGTGVKRMGVFSEGVFKLDMNGNGIWDGPEIDRLIHLGEAGDKPLVLTIPGTNRETPAIFHKGVWLLAP